MDSLKSALFMIFVTLMISLRNINITKAMVTFYDVQKPFDTENWTKNSEKGNDGFYFEEQDTSDTPKLKDDICPDVTGLSCPNILHACGTDDDCPELKSCCQVQCIYACFPAEGRNLTEEKLNNLTIPVIGDEILNTTTSNNATDKLEKLSNRVSALELETDVLLGLAVTSIIFAAVLVHLMVNICKKIRSNNQCVLTELRELNNSF